MKDLAIVTLAIKNVVSEEMEHYRPRVKLDLQLPFYHFYYLLSTFVSELTFS